MELDDIKLGMKVLVVRNRVDEGWTPILPDIADKFIGQVGRVIEAGGKTCNSVS